MLAAIAFYVLAAIAVVSALAVISARNPVHSVLFLILTFFTAAGLFVLLGAEFLAMLWWSSMSAPSRCCSCSS